MRGFSTILLSFFALSLAAADANPLSTPGLKDPLALAKGTGTFRLDSSFRHSAGITETGLSQQFDDWIFAFEGAYGLTDRFSLWLSIPLLYRSGSLPVSGQRYDADNTGLGDVTAGVRYLFFRSGETSTELAFDLNGKFPSGDTDIHFIHDATGDSAQLPLGGGYSEIEPGFTFRRRFGRTFSALVSAAYAFRFSALVEYLTTDSVSFPASDGNVYLLPVGNLEMDWGDQVTLHGTLAYRLWDRFRIEAGLTWFYRRPFTIRGFTVTQEGTSIFTTPYTSRSASSQYASVTPAFAAEVVKGFHLRASVEIPFWEEHFPVFPLLESAVGNTYRLETIYAF